MKTVIVKYAGMQEGFGTLPPRALFNVVGGDIPELVKSTVTLESLHKNRYVVKEDIDKLCREAGRKDAR